MEEGEDAEGEEEDEEEEEEEEEEPQRAWQGRGGTVVPCVEALHALLLVGRDWVQTFLAMRCVSAIVVC